MCLHTVVGPDPVDGAARQRGARLRSRILIGQRADLSLCEQAPHVMRGNGPRLGRLLGLMLEGGAENVGELAADLVFASAGRQIELNENRLPIADAVSESCPCRFVYSGTTAQQRAHQGPLNQRLARAASHPGFSGSHGGIAGNRGRAGSRSRRELPGRSLLAALAQQMSRYLQPGSPVIRWRVIMIPRPWPTRTSQSAVGHGAIPSWARQNGNTCHQPLIRFLVPRRRTISVNLKLAINGQIRLDARFSPEALRI